MTTSLPIPATSAFGTSANSRTTPANDAARFLDKLNNGDQQEAIQLFANLMGVDDPDKIPPISTTDTSSYEAALVTQIGAQIHMRQWAMTSLPRMLDQIKVQG